MQNWRAPYAQKELLKRALKVQNQGLQRGVRNAEQGPRTYCNTDTKNTKTVLTGLCTF